MKKVLVFGSSGFIGSALCAFLKQKEYIVHGADLQDNENNPLDHFYKNPSAESMPEIFSHGYDLCINCAGSASVPQSFENPFKDYELNTRIVFTILTAIQKFNPTCKFINLSSATVYGNPISLPILEEMLVKPISPYGNHKYMSELICGQFHDFFGIQTCSLRIFSAYGAGLKKQLFWDLFQKGKEKRHIELFGTGDETRDFIHVQDLVEAIFLISEQKVFEHRVLNVANGVEVKIKDVVKLFYQHFDKNIEFSFSGNEKTGDPLHWKADISKLKSLGYSPKISMDKGIEDYVDWVASL